MSRLKLTFAAPAFLALALLCTPAHAVSKDMIQLQTQIQQLQDAIARLQQSNDERMGVLKDLVQQNSDAVNKMSVSVDGIKLALRNTQDASAAKSDQLSGQVQSLNDSVDELKARLARMEKGIADIQNQQQSMSAALNNLPQPTGPAPNAPPPSAIPAPADLPPTQSVIAPPAKTPPGRATSATAAPIGDMYRTAYGDYVAAKYPLASQEFTDISTAYPDDNLAGNAYFYLGEIDLRTGKPTAAVSAYNHLIEHFPDNVKIPAAHLHKADAMISMKQNDKAALELRALIQRYPNSPEATAARTKLTTLARH